MALLDFNLNDVGSLFTSIREAITGEKIKDPLEMQKLANDLTKLENSLMQGQLKINEEEAKHPNIFVAGWRPAVGWVGVTALFFMYIPKSIVITLVWCYQVYLTYHPEITTTVPAIPTFPDLGNADIIGLLMSILGVGVMRSIDKKNGVDTKGVSR